MTGGATGAVLAVDVGGTKLAAVVAPDGTIRARAVARTPTGGTRPR
ncbi:hypothetical protein [Rhizomonospora bruguierae]|nr:hypothetical protein [Micromonospora sp. NBRC 107566]